MVLHKADAGIAVHYEDRLTAREDLRTLGRTLRAGCADLQQLLAALQPDNPWPARNRLLAQSIRLRTPYLLPLHLLQAELLRRRRQEVADRPADQAQRPTRWDHALMVTMTGIAAGLRNTG